MNPDEWPLSMKEIYWRKAAYFVSDRCGTQTRTSKETGSPGPSTQTNKLFSRLGNYVWAWVNTLYDAK